MAQGSSRKPDPFGTGRFRNVALVILAPGSPNVAYSPLARDKSARDAPGPKMGCMRYENPNQSQHGRFPP
jgi:hypothetical protein